MNKRFAKLVSMALVLIMVLGVMPSSVFAGGDRDSGKSGDWWVKPGAQENAPAVTLNSDEVGGVKVTVDAPEGTLPKGVKMDVDPVEDIASIQKAVDKAEGISGTVLAAVDITFLSKNAEIQPNGEVTVSMVSDAIAGHNNLKVVHIKNSGTKSAQTVEMVEGVVGSGKKVTFKADSFSVYAIIDGVDTINLLTVEFYDENSEIISSQAIRLDQLDEYINKNMEFVHDPGVPDITASQSFEGWAETFPYTEEQHGFSVEEINNKIKSEKDTLAASTVDLTWTYYAKVYNVRYVVYHDQAGAVLMTQAYHIETGHTTENVEIDWPYVGFKGGQNFAGWVTDAAIEPYMENNQVVIDENGNTVLMLGDYPLYKDNVGTIYQNGSTYSLGDTMQLYPYLNTGHWLVFDTYKDQDSDPTSTTFIAPDFYAEGETTVAPDAPERVGYEFKGWYKPTYDADGKVNGFGDRFVFGSALNEDLTLVAKWEAKNTTYRISVWQQLSTDTVDNNKLNNEYAYYSPTTVDVILTAKTGTQVSLADAYKQLGDLNGSTSEWGEMGYYFEFNEQRSNQDNNGGSVTVKGDGSTVLNAYYDRKLITINFRSGSATGSLYNLGGTTYVPAENGEYYYYEAYSSGYYLYGYGPNASLVPATGDTVYCDGSQYSSMTYKSADADFPKTITSPKTAVYNTSTRFTSNGGTTGNSGDTIGGWGVNSSGYYYIRVAYSTPYYVPLYYQYTNNSSYTTGYYKVGQGPTPNAEGTHNQVTITNPYVGLYDAPLYGWPADPSGYEWEYDDTEDGGHYGITYRDSYNIPDDTHTTTWNIYTASVSGTINSVVHWMLEKLDGSYEERTTNKIKTTTTQYYDHGKFLGFEAYGHNLTANSTSSGFVKYTKGVGITGSDFGSNGAYIFYNRRTYDFIFMSNNVAINTHENVKYQAPISSFGSYTPPEYDSSNANPEAGSGHEGYFFDGWYADPGCTVEYNFNTTMPNHEVTVYAKWTQIRFRVVVDPTGGQTLKDSDGNVITDPASVIDIPNGQATTFRINYGEAVEGTNFNEATREGYTLLGWYLDKEFTKPFEFGTPMTTLDGYADMTYGDASTEERTGVDPWKNNAAYSDNEPKYANVIGKITIYGKWRQNPDGVVGINVKYLATDKDGNTGKFGDDSTEWEDPNIYADKAMAFGQPASTPDNGDLQFLYWEILDKNGNKVGKAYPGQLWEVNIENAVVTDLTAQPVYVTAPDAENEPAVIAQVVDPVPAASVQTAPAAKPQSEPTRATHTYVAVTQPSPGHKYLITYSEDTAAAIMLPTLYSNDMRPNATIVAVSNGVIEGDYDNYLFGAEYYNGYFVFGNLNQIAYLSMKTSSSSYYPYYGYDSNNSTYTYWTYNASSKTLQNRGNTARYLYFYYSSSTYYWTTNTTSDQITFYELVEDEITEGTDFYRVEELKVGDKVVIAHDDMAMGNTTVSNSRRLNPVRVLHTVTGDEHITVPTNQANAVQWEVVSGNATNGYVLKNVANSSFLVVDSSGYLTVSSTNDTAWKYSDTDLSNTKSSSYPYLKFSNEFLNFDTSANGNRDIRLYAASRNYTVTFNWHGGSSTQTVEEGGAAVAPANPDNYTENGETYIFTNWDKAYDNITEDTVVTAVYKKQSELTYTVTFRYMTSAGEWTTTPVTVQHGKAATAPTVPTPPSGYTFNSWDKKFNNVTSNLTVNAVYKMVATKSYTVTLRAVYGTYNKYGTHVTWFGNNDPTGETSGLQVERDKGMTINEGYDIPRPEAFVNGVKDYTPDGAKADPDTETLTYDGHVFLGWARLEADLNDTTNAGTAHPELDENNLWLRWDNGEYKVNDKGTWKTVTQIAADELTPYHDLYAVWADVFYVYHSGTGEVERVIKTKKNTTYDLSSKTADGFLYGGYYTTYAGTSATYKGYTNEAAGMSWSAMKPVWSGNTVNMVTDPALNKLADTGATLYNGGNVSWTSGTAYKTVAGNAITPVAGTTYYIKEVPAGKYLRPYLHYTYRLGDPKTITNAWLISDIDDKCYDDTGFIIVNGNKYSTGLDGIATQITITPSHIPTNAITLTAPGLFNTPESSNNKLSYYEVIGSNNVLQDGSTVYMYWKTLDGLYVIGALKTTYTGITTATDIKATTAEISVTDTNGNPVKPITGSIADMMVLLGVTTANTEGE